MVDTWHDRPRWQFPVLETMSADLRFYRHELGLTRVSSEIADWHEENMYVYARLAWNPEASWRDALADFCKRSYGPAAQDMLQHWMVLETAERSLVPAPGRMQPVSAASSRKS